MVTWSTDSVHVSAAGDMAVETGSWSTTGTGPDGSGSDAGKYLTYYRKVDGAWKVAADVSSSGPPQ
jgi:ketosteroid isomerase-like protein